MAHLFHGVHEQHYIFHVMADALGFRVSGQNGGADANRQ